MPNPTSGLRAAHCSPKRRPPLARLAAPRRTGTLVDHHHDLQAQGRPAEEHKAKILQREWKDWCTVKGYDDADTVSEGKSSVRNPGHRGAEAEAGRQARLESERSSKRRKGRSSPGNPFEASIDSEATDDGEDTLFTATVGYSVLESAVNAVTELWKEQSGNPHVVLQRKELGDLLEQPEPSGIRAHGPRHFHRH
ncbi:hypothetical protein V8E54_000911 [Elaphomyces granulatus]